MMRRFPYIYPSSSSSSSSREEEEECEPFKGVLIFQVPELNFQDAELDIRTRELNFVFSGP
jgi:hypothetical protein